MLPVQHSPMSLKSKYCSDRGVPRPARTSSGDEPKQDCETNPTGPLFSTKPKNESQTKSANDPSRIPRIPTLALSTPQITLQPNATPKPISSRSTPEQPFPKTNTTFIYLQLNQQLISGNPIAPKTWQSCDPKPPTQQRDNLKSMSNKQR
jgi:hypothetical protein